MLPVSTRSWLQDMWCHVDFLSTYTFVACQRVIVHKLQHQDACCKGKATGLAAKVQSC
jgi:hypothetical protein